MKNSIILFLFLIPTFLFAQYPTTGNKSRLGWQTTGDGLIWRGVAGDTVNKPNNRNYPYFQLDTVNAVLYRYIQTRGQWQAVGGGSIDIDSLVYATRFWVNSNFFPLQGGLLTGTGGSGFVGFPLQSSPPSTPATGFSLFAGSTGNNISWMQPDGFFRRLVSPVTGTPRQYQFMARSYTLADSADIANNVTSIAANYLATSNGTNLVARNLFDDNVAISILNSKPLVFPTWTTAGRPASTNNYRGRNTTTGFDEAYFTSQWENYITSTGAANGQVSIFSSAGKTYGTNNLFWDNTNTRLGIGTSSPSARVNIASPNGGANQTLSLTQLANNVSTVSSYISIDFNVPTTGLIGQFFGTANNYSAGGVNIAPNSIGLLAEAPAGQLVLAAAGASGYISLSTGGYTSANERVRILPDGKVGIGTITPSADLEVSKNINAATFTSVINSNSSSNVYSYSIWRASPTSNRFGYLGKFGENAPAYKNMKPGDFFMSNTGTLGDMSFLNDYASGNINFSAGGSSTAQVLISSAGRLSIAKASPDYILDVTSTGAFGLPRGTVAQRPTIASSTTPFRYNTDSTALEYGESVGTWRQLATRAYARSLITNDTWLGTRLNAADVDINANGHQLQIDSISNLLLTSQSTAQLGGAYIEQKKWINTARTKYIARGLLHDSRVSVSGGMPAFYNLLYLNNGAGDLYEWTDEMLWDTTTNSIKYGFGSKFQIGFMKFTSARASSGTIEQNTPRFEFDGTSATENENGNTYHTIWQERPGVMLMGLKDGGKFLLNADSTMIFDPALDVPQFNKMGLGNKEATDLSKTQSNYIAGFATDGTVLDLERKRDTTIYVTDADYNFSAAITSANILNRYNRIIIYSKLSSGATSDNQIFLHTPSADFLQCEIIIYSNDASADSDATSIDFTTNGAVDGAGGTLSSYAMAPGQRVEIRVADDGGYKWFFN